MRVHVQYTCAASGRDGCGLVLRTTVSRCLYDWLILAELFME